MRLEYGFSQGERGRSYGEITGLPGLGEKAVWGSPLRLIDVDGTRVVVCYGYPPTSVFKQTLYTALCDRAGIQKKTGAPAEAVGRLQNSAEATGLFTPAGRDLKCVIDRAFTDDEVDKLVAWCEAVELAIAQHGLNATPEQ